MSGAADKTYMQLPGDIVQRLQAAALDFGITVNAVLLRALQAIEPRPQPAPEPLEYL